MSKIKTIKGSTISINVVSNSNRDSFTTDPDKEMDLRAQHAVKAAVSKARICKKPIAQYDTTTKTAYLLYPDGSRVNVK